MQKPKIFVNYNEKFTNINSLKIFRLQWNWNIVQLFGIQYKNLII